MASFLTAIRDLGRLRELTTILAKYGFGEVVSRMGLATLAPAATQAVEDGKLTLEDLRTIALRDGEPKQISGKQELYEMIVNLHI